VENEATSVIRLGCRVSQNLSVAKKSRSYILKGVIDFGRRLSIDSPKRVRC